MGIPLISYVAVALRLVVTMIVRRPPVRVTPNPLYWLLSFVGSAITVWAPLRLGRNIGFVPAQRELVSSGAYAYMRHPIYTGMLFMYLAFALCAYTPRNALLFALGLLWFIPIKSLVEESFLRCDPEYAAYTRKVRARWIPFVV